VTLDETRRALLGRPVAVDVAATVLSRGPGVYAWWAVASALPDFPGRPNEADPGLRLLYVGRAANLRGRILRTHLRRSGDSVLRRTLAGLLMPSEGYRTTWRNGVVLIPEDEVRLTAWMRRGLRLTWVEHPHPEDVEADLVWALNPPLNTRDVDDDEIRAAVVTAIAAYESSASPG